MIITDQEFVNDVKRKLESYTLYVKQIEQWSLEVYALETKINKVAGGSPKKLPEGNCNDEDWRSPLFEDIEKYKKFITINETIIQLIHNFMRRLDTTEKEIINKLFLVNIPKTYTELSGEYDYSRQGLQKKVDTMILKKWDY